ncbi:MAG TPA: SHOCT domain-containing protein [Solirubrobacterales bacterium]
MRAAMVGGAGYAVGKRAAAQRDAEAAQGAASAPAAAPPSESERVEALTKLKDLFDSGVLTEEQYESEKQKLLAGM